MGVRCEVSASSCPIASDYLINEIKRSSSDRDFHMSFAQYQSFSKKYEKIAIDYHLPEDNGRFKSSRSPPAQKGVIVTSNLANKPSYTSGVRPDDVHQKWFDNGPHALYCIVVDYFTTGIILSEALPASETSTAPSPSTPTVKCKSVFTCSLTLSNFE